MCESVVEDEVSAYIRSDYDINSDQYSNLSEKGSATHSMTNISVRRSSYLVVKDRSGNCTARCRGLHVKTAGS